MPAKKNKNRKKAQEVGKKECCIDYLNYFRCISTSIIAENKVLFFTIVNFYLFAKKAKDPWKQRSLEWYM